MKFFIFSLFIFNTTFASSLVVDKNGDYSFLKTEFKVVDVIREYAKLKGINLIMDEPPRGELLLLGSRKIKKVDIDLYISAVISEVGYTLIENEKLNQIQVIRTRDVRYSGSKFYTDINVVPDNYNHVMFSINLEHVNSRTLTRNMRPFMSRYGRIIDGGTSDTLTLADTGKNIKRLHSLIKNIDSPEFPKRVAFLKELNKKGKAISEKKVLILDFLKDHHVLFIFVFSLMAGIMGFGARGYMMKKIEAGW